MKFASLKSQILFSLCGGVVLGALVSAASHGNFWLGWLGGACLSTLLVFGMIRAWQRLAGGKALAVLMITAFLLRVLLGTFLYVALPEIGYDTEVQNAGYVFSDAHKRDIASFEILTAVGSWATEIGLSRSADQYGGMLLVTTTIYQIFSPHVHRPLLMVLFLAFSMTIGLAFLFNAVRKRWSGNIALITAWVFALYPESVLLGSSQMREPLLMGLVCIAFWGCLNWKEKPIRNGIIIFLTIAYSCFVSIPAGILFIVVLGGMLFLDWITKQSNPRLCALCWTGALLALLAAGMAGWLWLRNSFSYDMFLTESSSGWISELIKQYGANYRLPFITIYGLTQPLLPAAIADPSLPIWRGIAIFRALGWYFILPFILYGFFAMVSSQRKERTPVLLWFMIAFLTWTLISSLRSGGDQWDNPRYRTLFLPWLSILIGWTWQRIRSGIHPWFWRWVAVESIFLIIFLNWYLYRYYNIGFQIGFVTMLLIIIFSSALILIFGVLWDKKRSPARVTASDHK